MPAVERLLCKHIIKLSKPVARLIQAFAFPLEFDGIYITPRFIEDEDPISDDWLDHATDAYMEVKVLRFFADGKVRFFYTTPPIDDKFSSSSSFGYLGRWAIEGNFVEIEFPKGVRDVLIFKETYKEHFPRSKEEIDNETCLILKTHDGRIHHNLGLNPIFFFRRDI